MTSTSRIIVKCPVCDSPYNYDIPEEIPPNPRQYCKKCSKQFRIKRQIMASRTSQSNKNKPKSTQKPSKPSPPQVMTSLQELELLDDVRLALITCRLCIIDDNSSWREKLDAVGKLTSIKDKSGTLDIKDKDQQEMMDSYRKLPNETLAMLLNKSKQKTS